MSKLDVKSQKSMKQLTQPSIESLSKIIQKGKKINYLRCIQEPAIEGCRCRNEKREFPKNFYVCKILYPSEKIRKYPKCDHANDIVPNRDIFTHEKYMQFLATPKKRPTPPVMPRIITKNIPSATVHVHKLAQPRNRILMETFKKNCKHFSIFQIEAIAEKIYNKKIFTPQQAINEMKQKLCDQQKHVRHQKNEIKKLQKMIEKCNEYNILANSLRKIFRDYMMKVINVDSCPETKKLAIYTYNHLTKMFKSSKRDEKSSDITNQVMVEFSNKFASLMCNMLKNKNDSGTVYSANTCIDKFKTLCVPLDDYYPHVQIQKSAEILKNESADNEYNENISTIVSTGSTVVDNVDDDTQENLHESFMDPTLLNITKEQCIELTKKLSKIKHDIDHGAIKATASKKGDKSVPIEVDPKDSIDSEDPKDPKDPKNPNGGFTEEIKIKKKKKPKKKKGKKKNEKCFGNRDIKPQWAIEWRDKNEGQASKNKSDN